MKRLAIWDVDDTLFFANQLIGMEVDGTFQWLTQQEFHEHDVANTVHGASLDFSRLLCAADFISCLKPNFQAINRLLHQLEHQSHTDIVIMTARGRMDDVETFQQAFIDHGIDISAVEMVFAGEEGDPSWPSHHKKAVVFKRLLENDYDVIDIFDDNTMNLDQLVIEAKGISTKINTFRVNSDGSINKYISPHQKD